MLHACKLLLYPLLVQILRPVPLPMLMVYPHILSRLPLRYSRLIQQLVYLGRPLVFQEVEPTTASWQRASGTRRFQVCHSLARAMLSIPLPVVYPPRGAGPSAHTRPCRTSLGCLPDATSQQALGHPRALAYASVSMFASRRYNLQVLAPPTLLPRSRKHIHVAL